MAELVERANFMNFVWEARKKLFLGLPFGQNCHLRLKPSRVADVSVLARKIADIAGAALDDTCQRFFRHTIRTFPQSVSASSARRSSSNR